MDEKKLYIAYSCRHVKPASNNVFAFESLLVDVCSLDHNKHFQNASSVCDLVFLEYNSPLF